MYSKYNDECGKNYHCRSQITENGLYYAVNGIKLQNYTSFPPAIDLNFEDDENTEISKGFRQENKNKIFTKHHQYNYENDDELDGDDDEFELLSTYSSHNHGYQNHDHYKVSDYEYRQIHRHDQLYNHNDHSHQYNFLNKKSYEEIYDKGRIPPHSVHQRSSNKYNSNNNNNYYKKCGEHFIGDHQHQPLPTTEHLQLKS